MRKVAVSEYGVAGISNSSHPSALCVVQFVSKANEEHLLWPLG